MTIHMLRMYLLSNFTQWKDAMELVLMRAYSIEAMSILCVYVRAHVRACVGDDSIFQSCIST